MALLSIALYNPTPRAAIMLHTYPRVLREPAYGSDACSTMSPSLLPEHRCRRGRFAADVMNPARRLWAAKGSRPTFRSRSRYGTRLRCGSVALHGEQSRGRRRAVPRSRPLCRNEGGPSSRIGRRDIFRRSQATESYAPVSAARGNLS
jgi:hypothetical protein